MTQFWPKVLSTSAEVQHSLTSFEPQTLASILATLLSPVLTKTIVLVIGFGVTRFVFEALALEGCLQRVLVSSF